MLKKLKFIIFNLSTKNITFIGFFFETRKFFTHFNFYLHTTVIRNYQII